jgi:hypothetical protein
VHLMAADGSLLAQHDGVPLFGTRPTTTWRPGESFLDRHTFTVPRNTPFTAAQLLVGMYDSESIERQVFENGQDAISVARVEVDGR